MCIRDRFRAARMGHRAFIGLADKGGIFRKQTRGMTRRRRCLLYTSDAAEERSSGDLGGSRIIKKKTQHNSISRDRQASIIEQPVHAMRHTRYIIDEKR